MNNGRDYFSASIDTSQFDRDAQHIRDQFSDIGKTIEKESAKMANSFRNLGIAIAGVFTVDKVIEFTKSIVDVRSEFQNTEAMFKVFLGSAEKASSFMKDMQGYAFNNVFEFKDLTGQAAQLLAYGTAVNDVIPTIDKLSNIASGLNVPLQRFVELYNKAKSVGTLNSSDIQQWSVMGDVVAYLADMYGKSTEEVKKMVSEGKIGFKDMDQLLTKMTESGGLFNGMMEEKMKTLGDSVGLLQDSITSMLNEIGEDTQDFLRDGILLTNTLVENYKTIGEVIAVLVATYGTYRAGVIAVNAVEVLHVKTLRLSAIAGKELTKVQLAQAISINKLKLAWSSLSKTMLSNPYALAFTAVVGLTYATYKLATATTVQEEANKRLKVSYENTTNSLVAESSKLTEYDRKLRETKKGTTEYNDIKKEIVDKYGVYFSNLDAEIERVGSLTTSYEQLTLAIEESFVKRDFKDLKGKEIDRLNDLKGKFIDEAYDKLLEKYGKDEGAEIYQKLFKHITKGGTVNNLDADVFSKLAGTSFNKFGFKNFITGDVTQNLITMLTDLENEQKESNKILDKYVDKYKESFEIETSIKVGDEKQNELEKFVTLTEQIEKASEAVGKLKGELKLLRDGNPLKELAEGEQFDFAKEIEAKEKSIKEAQDTLERLTGKKTSNNNSTAQDKSDYNLKRENDERKAYLDAYNQKLENEKRLLDLEVDSFSKRQRLLAIQHEQEVNTEKKRQQALLEAQQGKEREDWENNGKQGVFIPKTLTIESLHKINPEVQITANENLTIAKKEYDKGIDDILSEVIDKYKDYNTQRLDLEKQYSKDLAILDEKRTDKNKERVDRAKDELEKQKGEALSSFDLKVFQESIDWSNVFGNIDTLPTDVLKGVKDQLQEYINKNADKLSPIDLKTVTDAMLEMDKTLTDRSPIDSLISSYSDYKDALKDIIDLKEKLKTLDAGSKEAVATTKQLTDAEIKRRETLSKMTQSVNSIGSKGAELVNSGNEIIDMLGAFGVSVDESVAKTLQGVGQIMSGLESIDLNKPFSVVTSSITMLTGLGKTIGAVFGLGGNGAEARYQAELAHYESLSSVLDKIISRQKELLDGSVGAESITHYREALDNLEKQQEASLKKLNAWGDTKKNKTGRTYWARERRYIDRAENQKELKDLLGVDVNGMNGLLSLSADQLKLIQEKMPSFYAGLFDETREYIDLIIESEEEAIKLQDSLNEALTGISFDEAKNSLKDLLMSADTTMDDIANNFEDYMRNAIMNILVENIMSDKLKSWYERFASAMDDDTLTTNERQSLQDEYNNIVEEAIKKRDDLLGIAGLELDNSSSKQQSSKGGFQSMSQETAGELNGRFTAMQMNTLNIDNKLSQIIVFDQEKLSQMKGMMSVFHSLVDIQVQSMWHLESIAINSKHLRNLDRMSDNLDKIRGSLT